MSTTQATQERPQSEALVGSVVLDGVSKTFGDLTAVHDLDLAVRGGEFLAMLGPSGSGKTTVLRMIAGFEEVSKGTILLGGIDVTRVPPHERRVNTVFQDYALFPHLTIEENVEYGLRIQGVDRKQRRTQVSEALEQVQLTHVATRLPHQLSGGQRQRIALARALILRPQVLLLDEPLGALDKQLREQMQVELKQIQRDVGVTFIFVTHDQEEALTLSDRIVVFNNGRVEQIGSPRDVYESPETEFVARFLGLSNVLGPDVVEPLTGQRETLVVRPERMRIARQGAVGRDGDVSLTGVVTEVVYTGPNTRYFVAVDDETHLIIEGANTDVSAETATFTRGDRVDVAWTPQHAARIPQPEITAPEEGIS